MYHINHEKSFILSRSDKHLAIIRSCEIAILFSMAFFDAKWGTEFDFPSACYVLVVSGILGLDVPKLYKAIKTRKDETEL